MYRSIALSVTCIVLASFQISHATASDVQGVRVVAQASEDDQRCLATTIYHEARGEPREGQIAVAHVVLNRRGHADFPPTICEIVKQGAEKGGTTCQFSTWCDGRAEQKDAAELEESLEIARAVLSGELRDPTDGARWFHASGVAPAWAKRLTPTVHIGKHQFYGMAEQGVPAK